MDTTLNSLLKQILLNSAGKIDDHIKASPSTHTAVIRKSLSGHNNQVYFVDFIDPLRKYLGSVCVKHSLKKEAQGNLQKEANILKNLRSNGVSCPNVLDIGIVGEEGTVYILMQVIDGRPASSYQLDFQKTRSVLGLIKLHESILGALNPSELGLNLRKPIDFSGKISKLLQGLPYLKLRSDVGFLNDCLNSSYALGQRTIVTDRSINNIICDSNDNISFIDFSTHRIGSCFDNSVQFIDDPRARFVCSKEELDAMVLGENVGKTDVEELFHAASIYANLLQGVFTSEKDPKLGCAYFQKANAAFKKLQGKTTALVDFNY